MDLADKVFDLTDQFPVQERYGLSSQMRRSSMSIPSNIAEGSRRGTRKDYLHFVLMAYGSGSELETQLEMTRRKHFAEATAILICVALLDEVMRMLNKLQSSLGPE